MRREDRWLGTGHPFAVLNLVRTTSIEPVHLPGTQKNREGEASGHFHGLIEE